MSNGQKPGLSSYLLPPQLRQYDAGLYPAETTITGEDDDTTAVTSAPRDFARGGQPGSLRPTGRQAGLQQCVRMLVPYLDQTVQTGFQPSATNMPRAVCDGVCDTIIVSMGKSLNSVGTPSMAISVDGPVGYSAAAALGGGSVAVADYYVLDQSVFTIRVQPGRHYVEALAVFQQSQAGVSVLTPVSVTFINSRGLF